MDPVSAFTAFGVAIQYFKSLPMPARLAPWQPSLTGLFIFVAGTGIFCLFNPELVHGASATFWSADFQWIKDSMAAMGFVSLGAQQMTNLGGSHPFIPATRIYSVPPAAPSAAPSPAA